MQGKKKFITKDLRGEGKNNNVDDEVLPKTFGVTS